MASTFIFNGRQISLPGVYSTIVSGEMNPARNLDYGKVLIIDTGKYSAGFGGGAGINGENAQGQNAIYTFDNIADFRAFMKGGLWWRVVEALFAPDPSNPDAVGISELEFVRAATTTGAKMTFATSAGGTFAVKTLDEGLVANGSLLNDELLTKGYGMNFIAGREDATKWILQFWRGTYTGTYSDGLPYGDITQENSDPELVLESPEFKNMQELVDWAQNDSNFALAFVLDSTTNVKENGEITEGDITTALDSKPYILAAGGTESFDMDDFNAVLDQIVGLDYSNVILDQVGDNAYSATTKAYLTHMNGAAKFQHFLYVAGYDKGADFSKEIDLAKKFDSSFVQLVHGGAGVVSAFDAQKIRWWGVMYNLCAIVGRISGKPPYVPPTFKTIGVDRLQHSLTESEKKKALKYGILTTVLNDYTGKFNILQGVNTLQDNANLFNAKGQSYSIQFMRIVAQINKELIVNATLDLLGQENGVNANTLTAGAVKDWTVAYLQSRTATDAQDNLILSFKDVVTTRKEDAYFTTYKIVVNNEITKLFFTGYLIRG
nr:MAG TPA: hypothetical protein [Herelleviridae sp.]